MSETTILDDRAVSEIEALSAKVPDGPWFTAPDEAEDVPDHRRSGLALVEIGRSADWWIARLCEWHIANFIAESKTNIDALCATVKALRTSFEISEANRADDAKCHRELRRDLQSQLEQLRAENERLTKDNVDLRAANLSNLLSEIRERLTPEEGEQFQRLLMSATRGWVEEVTERTAVDRGLLEAFKDMPKKKRRH